VNAYLRLSAPSVLLLHEEELLEINWRL